MGDVIEIGQKEKLKNCFNHVLKFFNPKDKPTSEFYERWLKEMLKYPAEHVAFGCDYIEKTMQKFPTVAGFLTVVDSIDFNAKKEEYEKGKLQAEKEAKAFFNGETVRGTAREYLTLIRVALNVDTMSRQEFIDKLRKLSGRKSFPKLEQSFSGKNMARPLGDGKLTHANFGLCEIRELGGEDRRLKR